MAKKKKENETFTFSEVGELMNDISKNVEIQVNPENNYEFLSTGIYIFNAMLSGSLFGGIQSNRITAFAGKSGVGKSYLAYNTCREAQKDGWKIMYIDTENAIERQDLKKYGLDISEDKLMLLSIGVVEDLRSTLTKLLTKLKEQKREGKEIDKIMFVVDSAGMLGSRKENEDAAKGEDKTDMTRAKSMASLFRIITNDLGYLSLPMIVTNHTYDTMDMFPQEVMKGGQGLYYSASTIAFLTKAKLKTGEEDDMDIGQSGIRVTAKAAKNRLAKPKKVKFEINFTKGCNPYIGLEAFCRPEFFEKVGIAQGKFEHYKTPQTNEETGEVKYGEFHPGKGNRWYVRHLDKHVYTKNLFNSDVFTEDVLNKLEPIVNDYFEYKSVDELEEEQGQFPDQIAEESGDDEKDADDVNAEDLF